MSDTPSPLETTHIACGRFYVSMKYDPKRASGGYMLRDKEGHAIFGGTIEACLVEAARLLEEHRQEIIEEAKRIVAMLEDQAAREDAEREGAER